MSGFIGGLTGGRIAIALGTIGVGALVGGAVADTKGTDVGSGALIGGLSAAAGIALLFGGMHAFGRFARPSGTAASLAASAGARQLTPLATTMASTSPTIANATAAATRSLTTTSSLVSLASRPSLFAPLAATVPAIARTPILPMAAPAAGMGSTFVDALRIFVR
ncbi:MAG: hypothetical protein JWM86_2904 [Thermoleophilia bacterium]|nr:hypothetical protein [Thermoleophilia bacterium]